MRVKTYRDNMLRRDMISMTRVNKTQIYKKNSTFINCEESRVRKTTRGISGFNLNSQAIPNQTTDTGHKIASIDGEFAQSSATCDGIHKGVAAVLICGIQCANDSLERKRRSIHVVGELNCSVCNGRC